jgi:hypothetical protein
MTVISRYFDQVRISNARITCFKESGSSTITKEQQEKREENLTRGNYNGYISHKTKIKIREYCHNWVGSVQAHFKYLNQYQKKTGIQFNLITLTLPFEQHHNDKEIRERALKPFLHQLQRKHRVRNYIHVSEAQKNGNLHFHIIIDRFIDHWKVKELWNGYMADMGYIDYYRKDQMELHKNGFHFRAELEEKWSYGKQVAAYEKGEREDWQQPNSTDIHRLKGIYNIAAYLTKYITKSDSSRPIDGRIWGCSDTLRNVQPITIKLSPKMKQIFMQLADEKESRLFTTDFSWTIWRFDPDVLYSQYPVLAEIWQNFNRHCLRQVYPELLKDDFFHSKAEKPQQPKLELVPVYQ